jgi:hypothetical protein
MSVKELIILGCGPTHCECRYDKEVWGVNGTYTFAKKLDKLFMTDGPDQVIEDVANAWQIRKYNCPLVLADRFPGITDDFERAGVKVEVFPIKKLIETFPTKFYSNSIAYMIAYALLHTTTVKDPNEKRPHVIDGYSKIYFYGIDLMTNSCYIQEKGGVEYWMGVALGMGVDIINTEGSATGKTWNGRMYGWWGETKDEMQKEKLLAPWEIIKGNPAARPLYEWTQDPNTEDWVKEPHVAMR